MKSPSSRAKPQSSPQNLHMAGIGLMLIGIFFFSLNDAMGKYLIATYSVSQLLLLRSAAGLAVLAPFIWREGWGAFTSAPRPLVQWLRPLCSTFEVGCFYWALAYMPLADVMTFYLAAPIYVTALSPFILREHVGWRRWAAVIIGFVGVMVALNPSAQSLTPASFVAIAGSLAYSLFLIGTRLVRGTSDVVLVTASFGGALIFGLVAAPFTWVALNGRDAALLILLGVVATGAHLCVNRSLKVAPASVVVPYQYTMIVWAIVLGYIFFGDIPRTTMLVGATIIIVAGIYIFIREQVRATPTTFADPP